jgi:hypothetical protein
VRFLHLIENFSLIEILSFRTGSQQNSLDETPIDLLREQTEPGRCMNEHYKLANQKQIARKLVNVRQSPRFSPSSSSSSPLSPATSLLTMQQPQPQQQPQPPSSLLTSNIQNSSLHLSNASNNYANNNHKLYHQSNHNQQRFYSNYYNRNVLSSDISQHTPHQLIEPPTYVSYISSTNNNCRPSDVHTVRPAVSCILNSSDQQQQHHQQKLTSNSLATHSAQSNHIMPVNENLNNILAYENNFESYDKDIDLNFENVINAINVNSESNNHTINHNNSNINDNNSNSSIESENGLDSNSNGLFNNYHSKSVHNSPFSFNMNSDSAFCVSDAENLKSFINYGFNSRQDSLNSNNSSLSSYSSERYV